MSIFSKEAAEWESSGYGCILYTPASHPGLFAAACPWINGADFRNLALEYPNTVPILVLVRDTVGGKVVIDKNGMPRIHYTLGKRDRQTMVKGMVLGLQTLAAAGASAVMTLSKGINSRFYTGSSFRESALPINIDDPKFQAYLKNISRVGVQDLQMPTFSAHQMGTVRMGKQYSTMPILSLNFMKRSFEFSDFLCRERLVLFGSEFPGRMLVGARPLLRRWIGLPDIIRSKSNGDY
jgi:long-chain-alcohol oxidase